METLNTSSPTDNFTSIPQYDSTYANDTLPCVELKGNACQPFHLEHDPTISPFSPIVYGYVSPILVLVTILTNSMVCLVLVKKNMRSPTNTLLLAMAVSDMLTGFWSVPSFIYFFTLGHYHEFVPYSWCFPYNILNDTLPTVFHTASIWLTVGLATQRYVYVCHSMKAKRWCTIPNTIKMIAIIYALAFCSQVQRFIEHDIIPVEVWSAGGDNKTMQSCTFQLTEFVSRHRVTYYGFYWWFRLICIHLVPCSSLVALNAILIFTMRSAQRRRQMLLKQNRKSESRRLAESNCTTAMLVTVVGVFLLVEFPLAVFFLIYIVQNSLGIDILADRTYGDFSLFVNLIILLSYPFNFFIYCGMSRHFRQTFKRLFVPGASVPMDREHSQYISLATENGANTACNTKDTAM